MNFVVEELRARAPFWSKRRGRAGGCDVGCDHVGPKDRRAAIAQHAGWTTDDGGGDWRDWARGPTADSVSDRALRASLRRAVPLPGCRCNRTATPVSWLSVCVCVDHPAFSVLDFLVSAIMRRRTHGHATPSASPTAGAGLGSAACACTRQLSFAIACCAVRCSLHGAAGPCTAPCRLCLESGEMASGRLEWDGSVTVRDRVCRDSAHDCRGPCGAGSGGRCRAARRRRGSGRGRVTGVVSSVCGVASCVASALAAPRSCGLCVVAGAARRVSK